MPPVWLRLSFFCLPFLFESESESELKSICKSEKKGQISAKRLLSQG